MAPEIILKQKYKASSADVFACGIILFIMLAGHPPFSSANPKDRYYACLARNKPELFWKAHSKRKPGQDAFFSDDFKNLCEGIW
jgi:serine/threonine protein kinase